MAHILEVTNLRKNYKDFSLQDISFTLERGYIMGFIGPNGSGKSTTIKLIMNLIKRDNGEIRIFGKDIIKQEQEIKQRIGFIYDKNYFYDELTLKQTKNAFAGFYTDWNENLYKKYLESFKLKEDKKVKELSKGMQMKFSLVLALSHAAELIIMDEPTSGLDPVFRREFLDIIMEIIQDERKAVFFSTHITTDLEKVADYITFINEGNLIFSKAKEEIFDNFAVVKGSNEFLTEDLRNKLVGLRTNKFGFEALTDDLNQLKRIYKDKLLIERAALDDIMLLTIRGDGSNV